MKDDETGRPRPAWLASPARWLPAVVAGVVLLAGLGVGARVTPVGEARRAGEAVAAAVAAVVAPAARVAPVVPETAGSGVLAAKDLIRLHIIANSDAPEDQALKLAVRDAILKGFTGQFAGVASVADAEQAISDNLAGIADTAARVIGAAGKKYQVTAEMGVFPFPVKTYGPFVLPAGEYRALRVVIGLGQGKNWWCILFPPVCFLSIDSAVAQSRVRVLEPEQKAKGGLLKGDSVASSRHARVVLSFRLFDGKTESPKSVRVAASETGVGLRGPARRADDGGLPGGWWPVALWSVLRLIQLPH